MAIAINDFLNTNYKQYAIYNCRRMIPNYIDGLKPVHRKILFTIMKNEKLIKVTQLAGEVMANVEYFHGENPLYNAIIQMAKPYLGHLQYLLNEGQFGSRLDPKSAAPRYLYTKFNKKAFFNYFDIDDLNIMEYTEEKEPIYFIPKIPIGLINTQIGIGIGFKTQLLPFDPKSIIENLLHYLKHKKFTKLYKKIPYYNGKIEQKNNSYIYYPIIENNIILDLPPNYNLEKIKRKLENHSIKYIDESSENNYKIILKKEFKIKPVRIIEKYTFFNHQNKLKEYKDPYEILKEFFDFKINSINKRIEYKKQKLQKEIEDLENKIYILKNVKNNINNLENFDDSILNSFKLADLKKIDQYEINLNNLKDQLYNLQTDPYKIYENELNSIVFER